MGLLIPSPGCVTYPTRDQESGKAPDSTLALMLEHIKESPNYEEEEEMARALTATVYSGGSDTASQTARSYCS